ncbi:hypothetical protein [Algicola sagamiensis]|uniref:hypothetical protein n=1 Tax=Algicola sagamiensis TaxID=163869 RepID=UPI000372A089|nr:hypothetical protein [Algicola sagamiensis]
MKVYESLHFTLDPYNSGVMIRFILLTFFLMVQTVSASTLGHVVHEESPSHHQQQAVDHQHLNFSTNISSIDTQGSVTEQLLQDDREFCQSCPCHSGHFSFIQPTKVGTPEEQPVENYARISFRPRTVDLFLETPPPNA